MTHSSYANEIRIGKMEYNERLEFLGDAVLEISVSDYLYKEQPKLSEGEMSRIRASIVCEPTLAFCSRDIRLGSFLLLGKGEELTGGRKRESIVSDALEALIGAIYLDGGFASAKEFVDRFILNDIQNKKLFFDSKTILQEMVQSYTKEPLTYRLVCEQGPDHDKQFGVDAMLGDQVIGHGVGHSKKNAEQEAAYQALMALKKSN
jgi:ribonuclease-3